MVKQSRGALPQDSIALLRPLRAQFSLPPADKMVIPITPADGLLHGKSKPCSSLTSHKMLPSSRGWWRSESFVCSVYARSLHFGDQSIFELVQQNSNQDPFYGCPGHFNSTFFHGFTWIVGLSYSHTFTLQ